MTQTSFKVGDRVRRINGANNSTVVEGSVWTVASVDVPHGYQNITLKETKEPAGWASNFVLVEPNPNLKSHFTIPGDILVNAAKDHVEKIYGITLASFGIDYLEGMEVTLQAEVAPA